jgi:hypothetical protein
MAIPILAAFKAAFSLLGLLDTIAGWVEKAQMKQALKAEIANDDFETLAQKLKADKDLVFKIRSDPALRARLRRRYTVDS